MSFARSTAADSNAPIPIETPQRTTPVDAAEVLAFLKKNCAACHNAKDPEAGVALDSVEAIRKGGDSGPLILPGKGAESLLLRVASHQADSIMPPKDNKVGAAPLTGTQLGLLKLWIDQGAKGSTSTALPPVARRPATRSMRPILAMSISPDDELLACSRGPHLHVYDLRGPRLAAELVDPALPGIDGVGIADIDLVRSVAFDRTGNWIASGGYRTVRLWQRPRAALTTTLDFGSTLRTSAVSPDGAMWAAGMESGTIELRDVSAKQPARSLPGHAASVTAITWTATADRLFSAASDKSLILWNVADGQAAGRWALPSDARSMILLDDGKQIAVGATDGVIRVWNVSTLIESAGKEALPAPRIELKGHSQAVTSLAAAASLKDRLVSGSDDGQAKLWDTTTGQPLRNFGQEAPVASVALRSDGRRLATVGAKSARLWNVEDGTLVVNIKGDWRPARDVARADGALVYARECVTYRKRDQQEADEALKREMGVVEGAIKAREMVEKTLAEKSEKAKKSVEERTVAEQKATEADSAFKASGEKRTEVQAALASAEANVKAAAAALEKAQGAASKEKDNVDLAAAAKKAEQDLETAKTARLSAEKSLSDATEAFRAAEKSKQSADRAAGEARNKAQGPERELKDAQNALLGAVNFIATANAILDKTKAAVPLAKDAFTAAEALVVEREARKKSLTETAAATQKPLCAAAFSTDGRLLAVGGESAGLLLFDAETGAPEESVESALSAVATLSFDAQGRLTAAAPDGKAAQWATRTTWELKRTIGSDADPGQLADRVLSIDFNHDGSLLATAGGVPASEGELKLWNVADGTLARTIPAPHGDTIQCVRFSPDGQLIATAAADRLVRLFRVSDGALVTTFAGHGQYVLGVAWSKDGKQLVSCGTDQVIKTWNLDLGTALRTLRGTAYRIGEYRRAVTSLQFVGETEHFLASSGDGTLRLHRPSNENDVRAFREPGVFFQSAAATSEGKLVIGGGHDGTLHLWNGENGYNHVWFNASQPAKANKSN